MWRLLLFLALSPHSLALPGKVKRHLAGAACKTNHDRWDTVTSHEHEAPRRLMAQNGDRNMGRGHIYRESVEENQETLQKELAYFGHHLINMGNHMIIASGMEVGTSELTKQQEFVSRNMFGLGLGFGASKHGRGDGSGKAGVSTSDAGNGKVGFSFGGSTRTEGLSDSGRLHLTTGGGTQPKVESTNDGSGKMSFVVDEGKKPANSDGSGKTSITVSGGPGPIEQSTDGAGRLSFSLGSKSGGHAETAGGEANHGYGLMAGGRGGAGGGGVGGESGGSGGMSGLGGMSGSGGLSGSGGMSGSEGTGSGFGMSSKYTGRSMPLYTYYEGPYDGLRGMEADVWVEPSPQEEKEWNTHYFPPRGSRMRTYYTEGAA